MKFEALRAKPREAIQDVFKFLLNVEDISGTYVEKRIDDVLALGNSAAQVYELKSTDGKFNSKMDRFTPELQRYIKDSLDEYCQFFDYYHTGPNGQAENEFQFFTRESTALKI